MDTIKIRVLQQGRADEINIGRTFHVIDLDVAEKDCIKEYEKRTAWCGGFQEACKRFYKRIALVDADTLAVVRLIYKAQ